jgi:anti-sigma factor RsiW
VIDCRELEPLLAAYVDGEAGDADRARVDAHVQACRGCRDRLTAQRTMCDSLAARRTVLRGCASDHLRARCQAAAIPPHVEAGERATVTPIRRLPRISRWAPLTAAATILLAVVAVFGLGLNNKVQALAFQASLDHAKCSRFNMPHEPADPAATAEQWQRRFGWAITVPASASSSGLELRGLKRCAVTDGQVAHIMYVWHGEPLSLYVLPERVVGETPTHTRSVGHEAVMWSKHDRTYMLVSNSPRSPALDEVAAYVRASAH